jgi:Zn-finger nucleic acid-binding protein
MFAGMEFCPHCGAKASHVVEDGAAPVSCPGCKSEMRVVRVGDVSFHECPSCSASWLTADAFSRLCSSREERGQLAALVSGGEIGPRPVNDAVRYVRCPVCGNMMNRQNFGRRSGVIIDVCKGHGVWFEQGELHAVLAFIERGGLELARHAEQEQLALERQRLELERNNQVFTRTIHIERGAKSMQDANTWLDDALRKLFT